MTKHPIRTAFFTALALSIVLATVLPYSTQEAPWALAAIVATFPFIWFFAWLIFNALAWWQGTMAPKERSRSSNETDAPPS